VTAPREPHPNHAENGTWIDVTLSDLALETMGTWAHAAQAEGTPLRFAIEITPDGNAFLKVRRDGRWSPPQPEVEIVQQGAYGDGT